ncbi:MAG: ribonuclease J, partial [Alphaproteobacteria bacterium]|nr:ribonuclease J [Alphaproteobacteria bacterium]
MSRRRSNPGTEDLVFLPLGGAGEIGMNFYLYGHGPVHKRRWLIVDMGVKFGDERDPGIDIVLPDISFLERERKNIDGIVLTHAHEDHFGGVPWLWPELKCPVFATPFTAELLRGKLIEHGLDEDFPLNVIPLGGRFSAGPFDVELVNVTHSIPEPSALAIRTPAGMVVHTGDWKIDEDPVLGHPFDKAKFKALGQEGCRALICDSTNALRDGYSPTETEVSKSLSQVIKQAKGRVAVTTFASNAGRVEAVAKAAYAADRHLIVAGRSLDRVIAAARATGYLKDVHEILGPDEFGYLPPDKVVCLCTGSQGEPRAALARIADDTHPHITLEEGDTVIYSSKTIPGNEKAVSHVANLLAAQGVEIIDSDDTLVHVTGHPRREELRQLYGWLKPELLVPMHGEMRHMTEQARFAKDCGIPSSAVAANGDMVRLVPGPGEVIDTVPAGRTHIDGRLFVPALEGPARDRRRLSFAGAAAVCVVLDNKNKIVSEPEVRLFGVPEEDAYGVSM